MITKEELPKPSFYFKVSSIVHAEFCSKRAKIETFQPFNAATKFSKGSAIATGNRLHYNFTQYMMQYKSFDAMKVKALLSKKLFLSSRGHPVYQKQLDDIVVKGIFDDLCVVIEDGKKYTSLIEIKTTSKKDMWNGELRAAVRQLQLYMWILKDDLEKIGYPLYKESLLLVYSQNTGEKLREIKVEYDTEIEEWIKNTKLKFLGLSKVIIPKFAYCRVCPNQIKQQCDWYQSRKKRGKIIG